MRALDLNDGTVKALLVLILIAANIALAVFAPPSRPRETSDSVPAPPAKHYVARP